MSNIVNLRVLESGLVPVYENVEQERLVNARELHERLGSKRQFADWIKDRIDKYGFAENEDYTHISQICETRTGATTRIDYYLKLDTAKEIAMVENNEQGRIIRKYFIEVEKRAKEMFTVPKSLPEALRLAAELAEEMERQKPLVAFAETCSASQDSVLVRELAKIASKEGITIGQNRLYQKLRDWGLIFPNSTEPYQEYVDRGYFEVIQSAKETSKGVKTFKTTRVTPKGQIAIVDKLRKEIS